MRAGIFGGSFFIVLINFLTLSVPTNVRMVRVFTLFSFATSVYYTYLERENTLSHYHIVLEKCGTRNRTETRYQILYANRCAIHTYTHTPSADQCWHRVRMRLYQQDQRKCHSHSPGVAYHRFPVWFWRSGCTTTLFPTILDTHALHLPRILRPRVLARELTTPGTRASLSVRCAPRSSHYCINGAFWESPKSTV